jgi:hypothetical protein
MVGRFNVRPGDGDKQWQVWDNAINGHRGRCDSQTEAYALAADLELQYNAHGPRDPATVRKLDQPLAVDGWRRHIGELDAWISEGGRWLGRVTLPDGQVVWLDESELRPTGRAAPVGPHGATGAI